MDQYLHIYMLYTIIGGGVQGLTTGILFEYLGYDTQIITESVSYVDSSEEPTVSSNLAAASIYPVQVEADYTKNELIQYAESSFKPFYKQENIPVRKHTHYYIAESPSMDIAVPPRMNAMSINQYAGYTPHRSGTEIQSGYICDEYFVEMPEYIPLLYDTYQSLGGTIHRQKVSREDISKLNQQSTIINCSGYGSRYLFADKSMKAVKGHILELPYSNPAPIQFSYTYYPEEYSHYTYMYPRQDNVLLGGSYLKGDLDCSQEWTGESMEKPIDIGGEPVPERLVTVNQDILQDIYSFTTDEIHTTFGYRPYRERGFRIEADENGILHNYGHGGSGVSLSWWSAVRVAELETTVSEAVLSDVANVLAQEM